MDKNQPGLGLVAAAQRLSATSRLSAVFADKDGRLLEVGEHFVELHEPGKRGRMLSYRTDAQQLDIELWGLRHGWTHEHLDFAVSLLASFEPQRRVSVVDVLGMHTSFPRVHLRAQPTPCLPSSILLDSSGTVSWIGTTIRQDFASLDELLERLPSLYGDAISLDAVARAHHRQVVSLRATGGGAELPEGEDVDWLVELDRMLDRAVAISSLSLRTRDGVVELDHSPRSVRRVLDGELTL